MIETTIAITAQIIGASFQPVAARRKVAMSGVVPPKIAVFNWYASETPEDSDPVGKISVYHSHNGQLHCSRRR